MLSHKVIVRVITFSGNHQRSHRSQPTTCCKGFSLVPTSNSSVKIVKAGSVFQVFVIKFWWIFWGPNWFGRYLYIVREIVYEEMLEIFKGAKDVELWLDIFVSVGDNL